MNVRRRQNLVIALSAVIGIPLVLFCQQISMSRRIYIVPPEKELQVDHQLLAATEAGLEYNPGKARLVALAVAAYFERGDLRQAENWLRLGAAEFRYPLLMLLYGDFLVRSGRTKEARRWYKLAKVRADADGEKELAPHIAGRLKLLDSPGDGK